MTDIGMLAIMPRLDQRLLMPRVAGDAPGYRSKPAAGSPPSVTSRKLHPAQRPVVLSRPRVITAVKSSGRPIPRGGSAAGPCPGTASRTTQAAQLRFLLRRPNAAVAHSDMPLTAPHTRNPCSPSESVRPSGPGAGEERVGLRDARPHPPCVAPVPLLASSVGPVAQFGATILA